MASSRLFARAPAIADQSETPLSQRKTVFSVWLYAVNVLNHSLHLQNPPQKLREDELKGNPFRDAKDLQIPAFHTENIKCPKQIDPKK
ncbi:3-oxoacyl-[acyl-carrier-protein] synthase [Tulasnella sp. 427]|nr:3-oxoacyl-[acyl-carrier-protein] synthase [Tulasnella sp. 427]